jgi:uncharacterized Zn finger protein (UPF0148 family)
MQQDFVCDECPFVFRVYSPVRRMGRKTDSPFYCPNCGENLHVRKYTEGKRNRNEYKRIPWTKEEVKLLKYYMKHGFERHQIALKLGRTISSVKSKMESVKAGETIESKRQSGDEDSEKNND